MIRLVYAGVDDTDMPGSDGTGRVARALAAWLEGQGLAQSQGITRHQLLVDPRIPYTSNNSSLCLGLLARAPLSALQKACFDFLTERLVAGADPGLCLAEASRVSPEVSGFGRLAQTVVLSLEQAYPIARAWGLYLQEVGGSGLGVIGALAAVGLRAGGNDGRFVELRGLRQIDGKVGVGKLKLDTGVVAVEDERGSELADAEEVDSQGWLRPSLLRGLPILRVRWDPEKGWVSLEVGNRHRHRLA